VDNREVEILDMGLLRQLASSTRGSLDLQAERLAGHA